MVCSSRLRRHPRTNRMQMVYRGQRRRFTQWPGHRQRHTSSNRRRFVHLLSPKGHHAVLARNIRNKFRTRILPARQSETTRHRQRSHPLQVHPLTRRDRRRSKQPRPNHLLHRQPENPRTQRLRNVPGKTTRSTPASSRTSSRKPLLTHGSNAKGRLFRRPPTDSSYLLILYCGLKVILPNKPTKLLSGPAVKKSWFVEPFSPLPSPNPIAHN